jgi:hypothetical protein
MPVVAEDVIFTLNLIAHPGLGDRGRLQHRLPEGC